MWRRKLHPYGGEEDDRASGREKGRWYARFAGEMAPGGIGTAAGRLDGGGPRTLPGGGRCCGGDKERSGRPGIEEPARRPEGCRRSALRPVRNAVRRRGRHRACRGQSSGAGTRAVRPAHGGAGNLYAHPQEPRQGPAGAWRGAGALAQRTLTDWADPDGNIDRDILGGPEIEKACGAEFNEGAYRAKLPILFGNRAELFDDAEGPSILRLALEGWTGLRNGSFHFKGRAGFARPLRAGLAGGEPSEPVAALVRRDAAERRARLLAALRAAHVEYCSTQEQLGALFSALARGDLDAIESLDRVLDLPPDERHDAWQGILGLKG